MKSLPKALLFFSVLLNISGGGYFWKREQMRNKELAEMNRGLELLDMTLEALAKACIKNR